MNDQTQTITTPIADTIERLRQRFEAQIVIEQQAAAMADQMVDILHGGNACELDARKVVVCAPLCFEILSVLLTQRVAAQELLVRLHGMLWACCPGEMKKADDRPGSSA